jgi:hypothetical protein
VLGAFLSLAIITNSFFGELMTHSEITNLWKKQRELYQLWEENLKNCAGNLRSKVEELLQPSVKHWTEFNSSASHLYVDLVDVTNDEKSQAPDFCKESFTDIGEFVFGVSVTFDYGVNTHPKFRYHVPLAVRYVEREPQYALFDIESGSPSDWEKSLDKFSLSIVERLADYFSLDPFNGPSKQSSIGFMSVSR